MWHTRSFCFSDDLEEETGFVWDGRYIYIYTDSDGYAVLAQVRDWTTEDGENRQQTHYFHCDQIGIPKEMTDIHGNLLWYGNYTGWGCLKEETKVTDSAYQPFRLQNQYCDRETGNKCGIDNRDEFNQWKREFWYDQALKELSRRGIK